MKGKELGRRVQVEQLVSDKNGDLAYLCAGKKLDYVIPGAGRLLELVMEICSNPDCIYLVHKTYSKSIILE